MSSTFMEMTPEENYADLPSPRILTTHVLLEQLPVDVLKKKTKIIYVLRNPKDVAVSYYKFKISASVPSLQYKGKWENYFRPYVLGKFAYGSWFDNLRSWETVKKNHSDLPILTLFYEDFKQVREMRKMCEFLGVDRSDEFLSRVCQNTSLDNMRSRKDGPIENVFRKGHIGDWKHMFTVAQNEWFDQLYQEKMKDCPLEFKFTEGDILKS